VAAEAAAAALGRTEFVIECLRTRFVCEGWHGRGLDEDAATRTLAYFRSWAAGGPDDVDEWMFVVRILGDHGGSIDWILFGDPVSMICKGASHSARAAAVDPIFAVIEEHRAAHLGLHAACSANDLDIKECPTKARAEERQMAAELPLFTTAPTTVLGVVALLEYLSSPIASIGECDDDRPEPDGSIFTIMSWAQLWTREDLVEATRGFPVHLAAALRTIIGRSLLGEQLRA
jgi:hypothetical protein